MADTQRQVLMDSLLTTLGNITIDNGYVTDAGKNVFEYRETPLEMSDMPGLNVRDLADDVVSTDLYLWDRSLSISISGYANGTAAPRDIRKIAGDVYKVLDNDDTFGGVVYWVEIVGDTTMVEHVENVIGEITILLNLHYKTGAFDPYTTINN